MSHDSDDPVLSSKSKFQNTRTRTISHWPLQCNKTTIVRRNPRGTAGKAHGKLARWRTNVAQSSSPVAIRARAVLFFLANHLNKTCNKIAEQCQPYCQHTPALPRSISNLNQCNAVYAKISHETVITLVQKNLLTENDDRSRRSADSGTVFASASWKHPGLSVVSGDSTSQRPAAINICCCTDN